MTLVSIIIPNYNYGKFLHAAVGSLVQQTYKRLELIIVDDRSSDDSRGVIESLKGHYQDRFEHFDVLFLRENRGKLHALNKGLPVVRGKVTVILDADDCLHEDYIRETVARLIESNSKNKKIAFVYTDCWLVDSAGNLLARGRSACFDSRSLQNSSYIPTCAPILTSVLQETLPFDERYKVGTKHHMWTKIVSAGWEGFYLDKPLFYYRMHDQNLSGIGINVLHVVEQVNPEVLILSDHFLTACSRGE